MSARGSAPGPGVQRRGAQALCSLPSRSVFAAQQPGLGPGVPVQQREHQGRPGVRAPPRARRFRGEPGPRGRVGAAPGGCCAAFTVALFCWGLRGGVGFLLSGAGGHGGAAAGPAGRGGTGRGGAEPHGGRSPARGGRRVSARSRRGGAPGDRPPRNSVP